MALRTATLFYLAFLQVSQALPTAEGQPCFPYTGLTLPTDGSAPSTALDDWWCPQSMAYGFQGFSYAMQESDCDKVASMGDQVNADFAQMKKDFGASVVRIYNPACTKPVVFEQALQAALNNNMALIFQVWTNFGDGAVWKDSQKAMFDTLENPKWKHLAPYIVHSADFGSEPIGDGMAGGGDDFLAAMRTFRTTIHAHNIQVGISEDWDRPGTMRSDSGTGLGPVGEGVQSLSDYAHIHPMPFYHSNGPEAAAWDYIQKETLRVKEQTGLPVTITATQWAWGKTDHNSGKTDVGPAQYKHFWKTFDDKCEWFKENNVGWFLYAWHDGDTFDIINADGEYVTGSWRPKTC